MSANQKTPRQKLIDQILIMLGNNVVDIDLTLDDLNLAVDLAIERYEQRSSNAVEEASFFLTLRPETQSYTLPKEIIEVQAIYRRGLSVNAGNTTSNQYDPFSLAYTNLYLLQPTGQGDLLTFEFYSEWIETAGKLFGSTYDFRWDSRTNKLMIIRHQQVNEDVLLKTYMKVSEDGLITGRYSGPWIRSYALAQAKLILGQAYEKFSSIPGPNGAITLPGATLKAEAAAEITDLENQLNTYQDGGRGLPFIIG
jgi:hypothetical protein